MDSIPSPQTILTMHDKLTMAMLPASVTNGQDYDSRDFLFCCIAVYFQFVLYLYLLLVVYRKLESKEDMEIMFH